MLVRPAGEEDLAAIAAVSLAAGQEPEGSGADPAYVRLLLETGTVLVAEAPAGELTGWGATRPTSLGWLLSDLFVHPDHQGRGAGSALLRQLWPARSTPARRYTFSSGHRQALPLYLRAGLLACWPLLYLSGGREALGSSELSAQRVGAAEAAAAEARLLGGDGRPEDYRYWCEGGGAGIAVRDGRRIVAAGAVGDGALLHFVTAPGSALDEALYAALALATGPQLRCCLPAGHPAVVPLLERGWRIEEHDLAMASSGVELPPGWAYCPGLT